MESRDISNTSVTFTTIANDGWCFYRTILHAYDPVLDTPENSWILACTLVNALRAKRASDVTSFDNTMKLLHMSDPILDMNGTSTGRTGIFTQREETNVAAEYISYNAQRRQFVETTEALLNGLITLKDPPNIAAGPIIWADVQFYSDVLYDIIGQYVVYEKINDNELRQRMASFDTPEHPYDPTRGTVSFHYTDRIHYELIQRNNERRLENAAELQRKLTCRVENGKLIQTLPLQEDELIELAAETARLLAEATTISTDFVRQASVQPTVVVTEPTVQQPTVVVTKPTVQQPTVVVTKPTVQPPVNTGQQPTVIGTESTVQQPPIIGTEPTVQPPVNTGQQPTVVVTEPPVQQPPIIGTEPTVQPPKSTSTLFGALNKSIGPLFVTRTPEPEKAGVTVDVTTLPDWAKEIFKEGKLIPACDGLVFGNDDCIDNYVFRDIKAADVYIQNALARIESDPKMTEFNDLTTKAAAESDTQKRADLEAKLVRYYTDSAVKVRYKDGTVESLPVLNPYRNKQARYGGEMPQANLAVLERIVPAEMRTDRRFTAALLESLWHCGSRGNLGDDVRCTPASILGELREWQTLNKERKYPPSHFIQNYVIQAINNAKPTAGMSDMLPKFIETPKDVSEASISILPPANPHLLLTRSIGTIGIDILDFSKRLSALHKIGTIIPIVPLPGITA